VNVWLTTGACSPLLEAQSSSSSAPTGGTASWSTSTRRPDARYRVATAW